MKISLKRVNNSKDAWKLHRKIFPNDDWPRKQILWVAYDETGKPIGFCGMKLLKQENGVFLSRAGVLPEANGHGLQRRMIHVRCNHARKLGREYAVTYTIYENFASTANLIKAGFHFYSPAWKWAGKVNYFIKYL